MNDGKKPATNVDKLVSLSVMGQIASPKFPGLPAEPYRLAADGTPFLLPTYGSIVYNVSVGDSAYGWLADCIHPSVSISLADDRGNRGLNILSCVGNVAVVMSGEAKGTKGVVTGKTGRFSEQVIVHFAKDARETMAIGDKVVVRVKGVGMELNEHPDIRLKVVRRSCWRRLMYILPMTVNCASPSSPKSPRTCSVQVQG